MILVTVGTHTQGFSRLIRRMDEIAERSEEDVVMQIGVTDYEPQHARFIRFAGQDEMEQLNADASVVVTHAGAGSILTALSYGKPVIVVPRLAALNEHADDHQLQITAALMASDQVIAVHDVAELDGALELARRRGTAASGIQPGQLVATLRRYLGQLDPADGSRRPLEGRRQG